MGTAGRWTGIHKQVAQVLLDTNQPMYGAQIADRAGVDPGSVYHVLARLRQTGWFENHWEDIDPRVEHRSPRRYYTVASGHESQIRIALNNASRSKKD